MRIIFINKGNFIVKYIIITMTCIFTFLLQTAAFNRESVKLRYDHSADIITIFQQDLIHNDAAFEQKLRQGIKDGIFYVPSNNHTSIR